MKLTGRMRVHLRDGSFYESSYGLTTMSQIIMEVHDIDSPVVDYSLEGRDY